MSLASRIRGLSLALGALCPPVLCPPALAQEATAPHLSIELNALAQGAGGCTLSFLARNGHPGNIDRAVFEAVLFDKGGQVDRLMLFDFADLPAGRPRVRQFVVPDLGCDGLGRILFNGASSCEAEALGPAACSEGLELRTRTGVEVIG